MRQPLHAFLLFCLLSGFLTQLHGQDKYTDSLIQELTKPLPDTARIGILLTLGDKRAYYNGDEARSYLTTAYQLARKSSRYMDMGTAMAYTGTVYYYKDDYDSALYYYRQGIALFKKDTSLEARLAVLTVTSEIGDVRVDRGDFTTGIRIYLQVIDTLNRYAPEDHNAIGNTYAAIANVYRQLRQYNKALGYSQKSLAELEQDKTKPVAAAFSALAVAGNLISVKDFKAAEAYLNRTKAIALKLNSPTLLCQLYGTRGSFYDKQGDLNGAVRAYEQAFRYAEQAGDIYGQVSALLQMGLISADPEKKDYAAAGAYLEKALILTRATGDKHREARTLKNLAEVKSQQHRNKAAVDYYRQYIRLSDSLNETETQEKINEIENKYQAGKKQLRIITLQKDKQLQQAALHRKGMLNIALIAGCALLLLIGTLVYKNFKNKHRLLRQEEALHTQQIAELEKERQLVAAQSVLKGQEEERSRLARDLHDGVGGLLSGVKLALSTMKGNVFLSEQHARSVNHIIDQLDRSITELRRVSHNMMPEALIKFGLKEALENYCENLNLSGKITVRLQTYGLEERMEQNTEIVLYRIIQELLNNVIRHAEADKVLIQFMRKENRFSLTVEDNGKGFDTEGISGQGGAGLANVRARAEYLDGTVDIRSAPGEGTSVTVDGTCG
ncbi:sensor histidine kinase [Compostibacter hankyongensis]|uniref:Histidine kinase domain-containing protein n=1 Tax=Compostibacter hankyongensis TaxID=1007089 RepID=A0ABP8G7J0_9BACT